MTAIIQTVCHIGEAILGLFLLIASVGLFIGSFQDRRPEHPIRRQRRSWRLAKRLPR